MKKTVRLVSILLGWLIAVQAWGVLGAVGDTVLPEAVDLTGASEKTATVPAEQMRFSGDIALVDGVLEIEGSGEISVTVPDTVSGETQVALVGRSAQAQNRPVSLALYRADEWAVSCELPHLYAPDVNAETGMTKDRNGNDVQPHEISWDQFAVLPLRARDYRAGEPFSVACLPGEVLRLVFTEERFSLKSFVFYLPEKCASYQPPSGADGTDRIRIEAEYPSTVSAAVLYPIADRSSAATSPIEASAVLLNTFGGGNWNRPGQWARWTFEVKKSGNYKISMRARQNVTRGMQSFRRIMIDGKVPCAELDCYAFSYDRDWQNVTLGDGGTPYAFYLEAGTHTLTMEAVMGEVTALYETLAETVLQLNEQYLKIVKVTGTSPDTYRTYNLDKAIPGLINDFRKISKKLTAFYDGYREMTGQSGSELAFISEMVDLVDRYVKDSDTIITTLSTFNSDISTLSTLLTSLSSQPLQLDYFEITGTDAKTDVRGEAGFFAQFFYEVKQFFLSFVTDYQNFSSESAKKSISVWISSGRDQANIMKAMIDDTFTPDTGIQVRLSLVSTGIVEAVMAGRGPDVAVGALRTYPMDLGARGVLKDLSKFDGFAELSKRFQSSAFNAYTYDGSVYGLPETQDFLMMFVRTDILSQMNMGVPNTWDDFLHTISLLAQNNLSVGVPITSIGTRLVQNGMTYYEDGFEATTLSSEKAYRVYSDFMKQYTDYEQPYAYNAGNRFKTGEMPIVIDYLSFFSTISLLAPEIKDSWEMLPIPGTLREDGTVNRASDATGTADIIFDSCADTEAAFTFLSWWTSSEVQARYGQALENKLGLSGRFLTANIEAAKQLNWTGAQYRMLEKQRSEVCEIPEIPGSYIITRNLSNIFYDIINNGSVVRESMLRYSDIIDAELKTKKSEMEQLSKRRSSK